MQPFDQELVAVACCVLNLSLNFPRPPLDVRFLHRNQDLIEPGDRRLVEVIRKRYFREQGQLGLAFKMGRDC